MTLWLASIGPGRWPGLAGGTGSRLEGPFGRAEREGLATGLGADRNRSRSGNRTCRWIGGWWLIEKAQRQGRHWSSRACSVSTWPRPRAGRSRSATRGMPTCWDRGPVGGPVNVGVQTLARRAVCSDQAQRSPRPAHQDARDPTLMGDGSLAGLPTPGHTPGSLSLLIRRQRRSPLLLVGDLTYGADLLERRQLPGVGSRSQLADTTSQVLALKERMPDLAILASPRPTGGPAPAGELRRKATMATFPSPARARKASR